jgi:hypothetical protein
MLFGSLYWSKAMPFNLLAKAPTKLADGPAPVNFWLEPATVPDEGFDNGSGYVKAGEHILVLRCNRGDEGYASTILSIHENGSGQFYMRQRSGIIPGQGVKTDSSGLMVRETTVSQTAGT